MRMFRFVLVLFVLPLSSCAEIEEFQLRNALVKAIDDYRLVSDQVQLGDKKERVLAILLPTQKSLPAGTTRIPDQFVKDGAKVEIHYIRSGWTRDGLTTDDEFTPYIFNNGVLVGVGWTVLGGPKTKGERTPEIVVR
ncbi:hypothetical protein SCL_0106 [Sulfuricaulis limicola]|uniref:Uncharacterized protein n=2 Tax=Sulfuricaulis limicola TaxID=1620215 RepID=A0A1B4XCD3_9GAMM|nr:hypothetical protein SCL_0106 [Sulfuricaulis limicola]